MSADTIAVSRRCDEVIENYSLLRHPFYRQWTDGTLPVAALKDYAREYGNFIHAVAQGWESLGRLEIARTEEAHAAIWENTFADALESPVAAPKTAEMIDLIGVSRELFAERVTALGGLYAFEAQQAAIADAKIAGLREHYSQLPESCADYFRLHGGDYDEVSLLTNDLNALTAVDRERALVSCERMCRALHGALTGIHAPYVGA